MDDSRWLLLCGTIMALCAIVMTGVALAAARDVRRALACWNAVLMECQALANEARRTLRRVHRVMTAGERMAAQVEGTVRRVCAVSADVTERVLGVRDRLQAFVSRLRGNHRTRAGSRPTNRRGG